jgi:FtsZ-binding cell division protein ZapB
MMAVMDEEALVAIADGLYNQSLDDFVTARTAAAREAASRDKELGAAVRGLAKPSVAAWAVNMLARHEPGVVDGLTELGSRMRSAQASLDAAALRELGKERRTLLADAVDTAHTVAQQQGRTISGTIANDVEETLRALTADEGAAAAVRSGRLLKALSADGVGAADLDGAVAVPGLLPAAPAQQRDNQENEATPPRAPGGEKRATPEGHAGKRPTKPRLEAVRPAPRPSSPPALARAKAALAEAEAEEARTAAIARDLEEKAAQAAARIADLQEETRELRERLKSAEAELERTRKGLGSASAEAKQASRAADKAGRAAVLAQERVLRLGNTRD